MKRDVRPPVALCLFVASAIVLSACGQGQQTAEPPAASAGGGTSEGVRIRFADLVNVDVRDVPLLMAFDALEAEGYIVEKTYLTSSTLIVDALARGDVDLAMSNAQTAWTAIAKGADIRTVAEAIRPTNLLVARPGITSCEALHGQPVARSNTTGFTPLLISLFFERRCPGTAPAWILLPEAGARAAALLSGRVAATTLPVDDLLRIEREADDPFEVLMEQAVDFPQIKIDTLHVGRAWAADNPDVVRAVIRAQIEAHRRVRAEPELLYEDSIRRLSLDRESARATVSRHLAAGIWDENGGLTVDNVQETIDFLVRAEALPDTLTAADVLDLSHLDAVLDAIGRRP